MDAKKAKALMLKKKKLAAAGVPEGQMGNQMSGLDEAGTDSASSGRAMLEQQNNALAQELLKKQQKKIKGY